MRYIDKFNKKEREQLKRVTVVAFDLVNTLVELARINPLFEIKKEFKIPGENEEFIKKFENAIMKEEFKSSESLFNTFCNFFNIPVTKEKIGRMVEIWDLGLENITVFPEVPCVLEELKKSKQLALLTNIDSCSYKSIMKKFELGKYFDLLLPSYEVHHLKPSPMIFSKVMLSLGKSPLDTLMVGDSIRTDIIMPKKLEMNTILLDRKLENEEMPSIQNLTELLELVY
jgi:putative hydrolase of the HAD superfamily